MPGRTSLYRKLIWIPVAIAACLAIPACGKSKSAGGEISALEQSRDRQAQAPSGSKTPSCAKPARLAPRPESEAVSLAQLLESRVGMVELDEVLVYHRATTLEDQFIGAFSGRYEFRPGGDRTGLGFECEERDQASPVPFISGTTLNVASKVHLPSGRVTVFDAGQDRFDDPQFNFPSIADLYFDSFGQASFKHLPDWLGKAPYLKNRYLSDLLSAAPGAALFPRQDGSEGFEIRMEFSEERELGKDARFVARTSVLVIYGAVGR